MVPCRETRITILGISNMNTSPLLDTYEQLPFAIERGEGVWVIAENGDRYLDMYGGHAVALLGHSPRAITDAITEQSKKLFFYSNIAPVKIRDIAGEKLASITWDGLRHIFFCNSGAEANENALKLAVRLTGRERFVAFKGSFHGRTLLASAVTDAPTTHDELKGWFGNRVDFIEPNNEVQLTSITEQTGAVILEPIQSIGGVTSFTTDFLKKLRERCTTVGALLIFDEVQTGMGRTGTPFVSGYWGIEPDMFTTAKGIASGYPIGALFVHDKIATSVKSGDLGSTYGGGPVAMAAVAATVDRLNEHKLFDHVIDLDSHFRSLAKLPFVDEIRGKGCLIGIKTPHLAKHLVKELLKRNIISGTCKDPYVLRLLPPIILSPEHIDQFKTALMEVCT